MLLALDTANQQCAACLYDEDSHNIMAKSQALIGRGHAEHLLPCILKLFEEAFPEADVPPWEKLQKIAVAIGPGSFTGLRVGVSVARSIALSQNIPAIGVSCFEAIAAEHNTKLADDIDALPPLCVAQDARRSEIFYQFFDAVDGVYIPKDEAKALSIDGFIAIVESHKEPLNIIGSAYKLLPINHFSDPINILQHDGEINIEILARLATQKKRPFDSPKPLYIRAADAKPQSPLAKLNVKPS